MNKKVLFLISLLISLTGISQTITVNPGSFNEDEQIEIIVSNFDPQTEWGVNDLYLWAWYFDENGNFAGNAAATGTDFANSPASAQFTNNGNGTYSYFLTPTTFYNDTGITQIGFLVKTQDGSEQSADNVLPVGRVLIDFVVPSSDLVLVNSGGSVNINAEITNQGSVTVMGTYEVFFNDVSVATGTCGFPACNTTITNITENGEVRFVGTPPGSTETGEATFNVQLIPNVIQENLPNGLVDGINYDNSDTTKATLVLSAPGKEFIQVAGSWNNYEPTNSDVMKQDPSTGKFWLEITGLTSGQVETYQYWVYDTNPIAGSPTLVKTADPYSTLVLSPFDDPFIPASTYPNLPPYPAGQEREVTVLQTGQTPYPWVVTNFEKPKKEDLIVYEVLVRDFDANRNYQDLINRIDYFKNLNINAIHLMPVMEFEGNESWGYNTSFHMALDKFYGTPDKLKEFIDLCHQNGIAIILDVVLNHAFGRNPLVRMWMDDPDGDGWGAPAANSPYLNQFPTHSFNVGSDFNHQQPLVQEYTRRVIKHWIEEYKIDGFRWDLTKGFTQNCGNGTQNGDFGCTNQYQQDRVDVLRSYADYSWSLDDTHYVIFEHLGTDGEEQQWANYRDNEGKGIMMWGKMTDEYNELTMAQSGNKNFNRMGHVSRGFNTPRLMGYPESHDEERLMYKNVTFGNSSTPSHDVTNLNVALSRMSALGAVSVTIPGPKMIWHFGDLGMENSIFTCANGTVNAPNGSNGDGCKLDTKPQPQWANNWLADALRKQIYDDWAKLHLLKTEEPVFEGSYAITSGSLTPRIDIFDASIPVSELRNVIILANFDVVPQTINTNFPAGVTATWYDLMDATGSTTVSNTTTSLTIAPGQFRILGNAPSEALSIDENSLNNIFAVYPNPVTNNFQLNTNSSSVEIYNLTGKLVKTFSGSFTPNDSFDISSLSKGVYMARVVNGNNQVNTVKLIKI